MRTHTHEPRGGRSWSPGPRDLTDLTDLALSFPPLWQSYMPEIQYFTSGNDDWVVYCYNKNKPLSYFIGATFGVNGDVSPRRKQSMNNRPCVLFMHTPFPQTHFNRLRPEPGVRIMPTASRGGAGQAYKIVKEGPMIQSSASCLSLSQIPYVRTASSTMARRLTTCAWPPRYVRWTLTPHYFLATPCPSRIPRTVEGGRAVRHARVHRRSSMREAGL